jgi:CubicO group peptidase (beta-lactamase class C family)
MRRRDLLLAMMAPAKTPAETLLERAVAEGALRAAVLHVVTPRHTLSRSFGEARPDTIFLLASISKPMTAAGVMALVEEGRLGLDDPVAKHLPEFAGADRAGVKVRHLLSHTSGLPDMLPDNEALRRRHAPLSAFLAGAVRAPLLFPPGSQVRYQSMGFLIAAAIAEKLTKEPFPAYLERRLLAPLGMKHTALGLGAHRLEETARSQVPDDDWGWNSPYWRRLASPWGGAHGTAADIARLLAFFAHPQARGPLRAETVRLMLTPQTPASAKERYGFGWRLGPAAAGCSERTFGHGGATGTASWHDPARDLTFVLLTTWPTSQSNAKLIKPVADAVSVAA